MFGKIGVNRYPLRSLSQMHPVRLCCHLFFPFLQKNDIACHVSSGVFLEGIVWQSYGTHQLRPFRKISAHRRICLVQCSLAGYKSDNAARSDLIQRLRKKVIMDMKVMLCISGIVDLIIPKRYITNRYIKKIIRVLLFLKTLYTNICFRV